MTLKQAKKVPRPKSTKSFTPGDNIHYSDAPSGEAEDICGADSLLLEMFNMDWQFMSSNYYETSCCGAVYNKDGRCIQLNNAEFGRLDHPELYMGLHGVPAPYENGASGQHISEQQIKPQSSK